MTKLIFCTDVTKEFSFQYPVSKTIIENCRIQNICAGILTIEGTARPCMKARRSDDLSEQYDITLSVVRFNDGSNILELLDALETNYVFPFYDDLMNAVYEHVDWMYNYDDRSAYASFEMLSDSTSPLH